MYEDKTLVCKRCSKEFVFTAGEQGFTQSAVSRTSRSAAKSLPRCAQNAARGPREFFTATCASGGEARVPFEPNRPPGILQRVLRKDA